MNPSATPDLSQQLLSTIRQHGLCSPGDRLIVGVSGGADSVALLDLLVSLPEFPLQLVVAHLNHQLRGAEADADEAFVRELSNRYGLPCEVARRDIRQLAHQTGRSLEDAGREARYAFFEELRQRRQAAAVAVAHHADDQAETVLLRLLRGAGMTGLAAMAPSNRHNIIRPLLEITRQELRNHLASRQISFREDASNADHSYLRNRVRLELLPLLDDYCPGISGRLAATAGLIREDEALLEGYTDATFNQLATTGPNWVSISRHSLAEQPPAMRLRLFRAAVKTVLGELKQFDRLHFTLLEALLQNAKTGASLNLPRDLVVLLTADNLLFARQELLHPAPPRHCEIGGPGSYELGNGLVLTVEEGAIPESWQGLPHGTTYVDIDQAPFPWQVRPIAPGDRLELLGMEGERSIQDILTDLKFPRHVRPCLPLICHNGRPLWLAGVRRTRLALIRTGSKQGVRVALTGREKIPLFP